MKTFFGAWIILFLYFQEIYAQQHPPGASEFKCSIYGQLTVNEYACTGLGITIKFNPKVKATDKKTYFTDKNGFYCVDAKIEENQYICYTIEYNDPAAPSACFSYDSIKFKVLDLNVNSAFQKGKTGNCARVRPWRPKKGYSAQ